jgi:hypothetical protein
MIFVQRLILAVKKKGNLDVLLGNTYWQNQPFGLKPSFPDRCVTIKEVRFIPEHCFPLCRCKLFV